MKFKLKPLKSACVPLPPEQHRDLHEIANRCLFKTKVPYHGKSITINRKLWLTPATRTAKQEPSCATDIGSQFPDSDYLRKNFNREKKTNRKLVDTLDRNKNKFCDRLNTDIESGKIVNRAQFKTTVNA